MLTFCFIPADIISWRHENPKRDAVRPQGLSGVPTSKRVNRNHVEPTDDPAMPAIPR
jgi:hypothetical protein